MSGKSCEFDNDPNAPVEVQISKRFTLLSLLGGGIALLMGLALEWDLYPRLASLLPPGISIPVISGWWLAVIGGLFFGIGVYSLIANPTLLRLDSDGLHSPAQRLSIPWGQILGVRDLITGGGGGRYMIVRITGMEAVPSAKASRRKHFPIRNYIDENEVPIALTGGTLSLESAVSLVEAKLAKTRPC